MLGVAYKDRWNNSAALSCFTTLAISPSLLGLERQQKRQNFKIVAPTVTVVTQKQVFHVPRSRIAELQESNGKGQEKFHRTDLANLVKWCMMQTYSMQTYANLRETLRREASCRLLSQVDCATWSVTTGPKSVHAEHLKCSKCSKFWNATGLTNQTCFSRLAPILESCNVRYAHLAVSQRLCCYHARAPKTFKGGDTLVTISSSLISWTAALPHTLNVNFFC